MSAEPLPNEVITFPLVPNVVSTVPGVALATAVARSVAIRAAGTLLCTGAFPRFSLSCRGLRGPAQRTPLHSPGARPQPTRREREPPIRVPGLPRGRGFRGRRPRRYRADRRQAGAIFVAGLDGISTVDQALDPHACLHDTSASRSTE